MLKPGDTLTIQVKAQIVAEVDVLVPGVARQAAWQPCVPYLPIGPWQTSF